MVIYHRMARDLYTYNQHLSHPRLQVSDWGAALLSFRGLDTSMGLPSRESLAGADSSLPLELAHLPDRWIAVVGSRSQSLPTGPSSRGFLRTRVVMMWRLTLSLLSKPGDG